MIHNLKKASLFYEEVNIDYSKKIRKTAPTIGTLESNKSPIVTIKNIE